MKLVSVNDRSYPGGKESSSKAVRAVGGGYLPQAVRHIQMPSNIQHYGVLGTGIPL